MSAAEVLAQHQWGTGACICGPMVCSHADMAAHQLDVLKAAGYLVIPQPKMAPFGTPLASTAAVQEIWDAFVVPSQADDAPPQSVEMRALMAVLRAVHAGFNAAESSR